MKLENLQSKINGYQSSMLQALEQLVNLESPSTDKPALDTYAQNLAGRFETLGAETTLIANPTSGAQLKAAFRTPQTGSDRPGLLLCHYDTVWPM